MTIYEKFLRASMIELWAIDAIRCGCGHETIPRRSRFFRVSVEVDSGSVINYSFAGTDCRLVFSDQLRPRSGDAVP